MNTFLFICIAGIMINSVGISLNLYILNIFGCIFTVIGIIRLDTDSIIIKKVKRYAILSIPFAILAFLFSLLDTDVSVQTISSISLGINIFFFIYFTYYFTEMLIDCAKGINELAVTRNFRSIWTLCGIIAFLYFMAYTSQIPAVTNIAKIILLISSFYYCFSINSASRRLFIKK